MSDMRHVFGWKVAAAVFALALSACSSAPKVTRVDADTVTDLDGRWNDTDVRIVCADLIGKFLDSPMVAKFRMERGRLPVIKVSGFRNKTQEHMEGALRMMASRMETEILNSGKAQFVANSEVSSVLRGEAEDQSEYAREDSAAALAQETAADFLITGEITSIIQEAGGKKVAAYTVSAQATNIETHLLVWKEENSEIKKIITRPKVKL